MTETKESSFQDAVEWANSEDKKSKINRKKGGINTFYLVLGSLAILVLIIFIVYLIGRDPDNVNALEMMKDDRYAHGGYEEEYIIEDGDYDDAEYVDVGYGDIATEYVDGGIVGDGIVGGIDGDGYEYVDEYVDVDYGVPQPEQAVPAL